MNVENDDYEQVYHQTTNNKLPTTNLYCGRRLERRSLPVVAGAIAGGITVKGLDVFSTQADKAILQALMDCGTNISIEEKQITINSSIGKGRQAISF